MIPIIAWIASGLALALFVATVIAPTLSNERLRSQLTGANPFLTLGIALNLAAQALQHEDPDHVTSLFFVLVTFGGILVIIGAVQMRRERKQKP